MGWGSRKAVKRSLVIDNNIKYSIDNVGEEALFSLRVLLNSEKISFINKICYHYVNYPNSQSSKGDNDPWGAVCKRIQDYLNDIGLYDKYKFTVNSFAYTAFIVSIYRISQNYNMIDAISKSNEASKAFKSQYSIILDTDSLETRTRVLLPLVKT